MRRRLAIFTGLFIIAGLVTFALTRGGEEPARSSAQRRGAITTEHPQVIVSRTTAPVPAASRALPSGFELIITSEGHQVGGAVVRVLAEDATDSATQTTSWRLVSQGVTTGAPLVLETQENGRHLIEVAPPEADSAPTFVYVMRQAAEQLQRVRIELEPSQPLDVTVETARHEVVPHALLTVTPTFIVGRPATAGALPRATQRSFFTNEFGQVRMSLTRGRYWLEASRSVVERGDLTLDWPSKGSARITLTGVAVLEGQVLLPDAGPAANAMVYDYFEHAAGPQTLADRSGRFSFEVEPGLHRLGAELGGLSGSTERLELDAQTQRRDLLIRLASTARMHGVVTDVLKHTPIASATVSITPYEVSGEVAHEVTDADGGWSANVPAGRWDIEVTHAGYEPTANSNVLVAPGLDFSLDTELAPLAAIHGTLRTTLGAPVAAATIVFSYREGGSPLHLPRTSTTALGTYLLGNVPSGSAFLVVTPPNGRQFNAFVEVPAGENIEKNLTVPDGPQWLTGQVTVHGPHRGEATVTAISEGETVDLPVIDGGFAAQLAHGQWVLRASFGGVDQRRDIRLSAQQAAREVFEFQAHQTRVLRVVDQAGNPVRTQVRCMTHTFATIGAFTNHQGLLDVPSESVRCTAGDEHVGGSVEMSPGDAPLTITLATTQLTLAFQQQGRPFAGVCEVTLRSDLSEVEQLMSGGEVTFEVPADTAFRVIARCPEAIDQRVDSGNTPSRVVINLDAYGTAVFHTIDREGHAAAHVHISAGGLTKYSDDQGNATLSFAEGHHFALVQGGSKAVRQDFEVTRNQTTSVTVVVP